MRVDVVVDPHSAEAFPARGLRPSTPNVVFVLFYIRHSHNKGVDVHDYAFPDGRWVLGLYDVDANASSCFDPACPLAEPDPNEFPAFESALRLLNLPASTFKTRESVRLQHSDSENSGFHVCIFASNYLKTGRVGESTMSLEIMRTFVLTTYQYVMEPAEMKDLLADLDALSISDAPPSSKKFALDPTNMYPHSESTSPAGAYSVRALDTTLEEVIHKLPSEAILHPSHRTAQRLRISLAELFAHRSKATLNDLAQLIVQYGPTHTVKCPDCCWMIDMCCQHANEYLQFQGVPFPLSFAHEQRDALPFTVGCEFDLVVRRGPNNVRFKLQKSRSFETDNVHASVSLCNLALMQCDYEYQLWQRLEPYRFAPTRQTSTSCVIL